MSRPAASHPLGPCSSRFEILLPAALIADIKTAARIHNKSAADYVREVIEQHVAGELTFISRRVSPPAQAAASPERDDTRGWFRRAIDGVLGRGARS